jgi:hypothetical protein
MKNAIRVDICSSRPGTTGAGVLMAVMKNPWFAFNDDVQRNILAHQAVSSERGSLGMARHPPGHRILFLHSWNAIRLPCHLTAAKR